MEPDDIEDGYYPEAIGLTDGECIIFDPAEFEEEFNCFGVMVRDGALFILCKDQKKWLNVESRPRAGKLSGPRSVQ